MVKEFKCHGSYLTPDNNIENEIDARIAVASAVFQRMKSITCISKQYMIQD